MPNRVYIEQEISFGPAKFSLVRTPLPSNWFTNKGIEIIAWIYAVLTDDTGIAKIFVYIVFVI